MTAPAADTRARGWLVFSGGLGLVILVGILNRLGVNTYSAGLRPAVYASGITTTLMLAASIAGRGRAIPGLRWVPVARIVIALLVLGIAVRDLHEYFAQVGSSDGMAWKLPLGASVSLLYLALCEASARLGGPSVALWGSVLATALSRLTGSGGAGRLMEAEKELFVLIAILSALRLLRFTRKRLRSVGVVPWAASEVSFVPPTLQALVTIVLASSSRDPEVGELLHGNAASIVLPLVTVAATVLGLRYLERRLRAAEAFAGARVAAAAAGAPAP